MQYRNSIDHNCNNRKEIVVSQLMVCKTFKINTYDTQTKTNEKRQLVGDFKADQTKSNDKIKRERKNKRQYNSS